MTGASRPWACTSSASTADGSPSSTPSWIRASRRISRAPGRSSRSRSGTYNRQTALADERRIEGRDREPPHQERVRRQVGREGPVGHEGRGVGRQEGRGEGSEAGPQEVERRNTANPALGGVPSGQLTSTI